MGRNEVEREGEEGKDGSGGRVLDVAFPPLTSLNPKNPNRLS